MSGHYNRPPADFAAQERALWNRSRQALERLGVWDRCDTDALERFCRASALARVAREKIASAIADGADPYITKGSMGQAVVGPLIDLQRRATADADGLARELGLTPMARRRLGLGETRDSLDAELERLIEGS